MKKLFALFFALVIPLYAMAVSPDELQLSKLTKEQQATLLVQAAQMQKDNTASGTSTSTREVVKEWATLGADFGHGLASTAHELGIEANAFVNTPVGRLTAAIIVWKLMGGALIHIFGGTLFAVIFFTVWLRLYRKQCVIKEVTYGAGGHFGGLFAEKKVVHYTSGEVSDNTVGTYLFILAVGTVISLVWIFTY